MRRVVIAAALLAAALGTVGANALAQPFQTGQGRARSGERPSLAADMMAARIATAKYAGNLARAKADGYGIITKMIPSMGYHFLNPGVTKFDLRRPAILVYEHHGRAWQLGAVEWVFPSIPATPPLPGAKYGVFGAACHYVDGTFVFQAEKSRCPSRSPQTHARFNFWHGRLVTLHFWVWYPNPAGVYSGLNPNVSGFNNG